MSIEKVRSYLSKWNKDKDIIEFDVSTATVELAAQALHTIPDRIAKSISFLKEDHALLVVAAGNEKIDNKKFKDTFGVKAKMLNPEQVLRYTGFAVGGVCPFALPDTAEVYLDISMKKFQSLFPACGTSNSAIELTIAEIEMFTPFIKWVVVCKVRE